MSDRLNRDKRFAYQEFDFVGQEESTTLISGSSSDTEQLSDAEVDSLHEKRLDAKNSGMKEEDYNFINPQFGGDDDLNFPGPNTFSDSAASANGGVGATQIGAADEDLARNGFIPRFGGDYGSPISSSKEKKGSSSRREHGHRRFRHEAKIPVEGFVHRGHHGSHRSHRIGVHGHEHPTFGHQAAYGVYNNAYPVPGLSYFNPFVNDPPIGSQLPYGASARLMARPFHATHVPLSYDHHPPCLLYTSRCV